MEEYRSCYTDSYARDGASGASYDKGVSNRFELFIFQIEKRILLDILLFVNKKGTDIEYLDYACGTGRILSVFKEKIKNIFGMDTSQDQMIEAEEKVPSAEFIAGNIVTEPELLDGRSFDLITCFRLFLNLEKENRAPVLKKLCEFLKEDGTLAVDNHMNRYSILGLIALFMRKVLGYPEKSTVPCGSKGIIGTMSEKQMRSYLKESGLEVVRVYRFVLFPGHKSFLLLPGSLLLKVEWIFSKVPLVNLFSKNQIFVCRKQKKT